MKSKLNLAEVEEKFFFVFDIVLIVATATSIIITYFHSVNWTTTALAGLSFLGLLPVLYSTVRSLIAKRISVDLLASVALIFSLISKEWFSAAFIILMLAFARVFDHITQARAKRIIQSLMKYHVERVRVKHGEAIKEVHIREVKPGDMVVIDAGDRVPVDGTVVSGNADLDESSLTGESELVSKKAGDKVFTSTVNDSGSLIIRTEKVGRDTTLSKIISLVEEASRDKSPAERVADRFTQWYIGATLVISTALYIYGLPPSIILSLLLVVCADDIAVAVPLAFTAAISRSARRGVIIKGSAALEQLSRLKYMLADKTGTLSRGKPKVVDVKAYDGVSVEKVVLLAGMAAAESKHMVSRAILEYLDSKKIHAHAPDDAGEISGQGVLFMSTGADRYKKDRGFMGRMSYVEKQKMHIPHEMRIDYGWEKDAGRGVVIIVLNGNAVGLISYRDELRPHMREIIEETRRLGIREWHMLTGDNERAASAVAHELDLRDFHANMTPETKVEFIRRFEKERKRGDIVAYIGDGVNDAASLVLVDVSIAMGGIGSDAAIEAADITIMHDQIGRLPEIMRTAQSVRAIMWQCFAIWAITNIVGLSLVCFGVIGPVGAAAYNFLTDFIPIGNALRAGSRRVRS